MQNYFKEYLNLLAKTEPNYINVNNSNDDYCLKVQNASLSLSPKKKLTDKRNKDDKLEFLRSPNKKIATIKSVQLPDILANQQFKLNLESNSFKEESNFKLPENFFKPISEINALQFTRNKIDKELKLTKFVSHSYIPQATDRLAEEFLNFKKLEKRFA